MNIICRDILPIEMLQFVFACGKSETDDVMTNVPGAAIGYLIARLKRA